MAGGQRLPARAAVLNDTADPVAVIRNGLSAQIDQNGAVVLAGPPVNLLGVIARPDGRDLGDQQDAGAEHRCGTVRRDRSIR